MYLNNDESDRIIEKDTRFVGKVVIHESSTETKLDDGYLIDIINNNICVFISFDEKDYQNFRYKENVHFYKIKDLDECLIILNSCKFHFGNIGSIINIAKSINTPTTELNSADYTAEILDSRNFSIEKKIINDMSKKPTLAFATMCKNEEHILIDVLKSVINYVDYIAVVDTGSTDSTVEKVKEFLSKSDIDWDVHEVEWQGFDVTKTIMMSLVYGKTDYVLTFDADDILHGDFSFEEKDTGFDLYFMTMQRGAFSFKATVIYDNRLRWKFCGVAHTTIKCLDKDYVTYGDLCDRGYVSCEELGSRKLDSEKYLKDAEKLKKQFWDTLLNDPDGLNIRSVFYTAQSYMDYGMLEESIKWYKLYTKLNNTWTEELFEAQMRIAECKMRLNYDFEDVYNEMSQAIQIFEDRAEPHYKLGLYCNQISKHELAYKHLKIAKSFDIDITNKKYILFVNYKCYGKFINDELSVSCYWLGKFEEGLEYLNEIIDDDDFSDQKERLDKNKFYFLKSLKLIE